MIKNKVGMENSLVELRLAAEVANGNAPQIVKAYLACPSIPGGIIVLSDQERVNIRKRFLRECKVISRIAEVIHAWDSDTIDLIQRAVVLVLKTPPIFVGGLSYPTAHEAALAMGQLVLNIWQESGGDNDVDGNDNVIGSVRLELWRQMQALHDKMPTDLWGAIQQEYKAAVGILGGNSPSLVNQQEYSTKMYTPKELRKLFGISQDTLSRRLKSQEIRNIKHSTRSYQIHPADLPDAEN